MIINGTDLYMWQDDVLLATSTSYTLNIEVDPRERTNKGTGTIRTYAAGLMDVSASCDGLFVYDGSYDIIRDAIVLRLPVKLEFGEKQINTLLLDTTIQFDTGYFIITSLEKSAGDAENATYSASFKHSTGFGRGVETVDEFYWVSPTGVDGAGVDGSSDTPWLTLAYACTRVTTAGAVIHLTAGTFTETTYSELAVGVSIIGAGATTIITTAAALAPLMRLHSASQGTDGNQSISYLTFDGNLTAQTCMTMKCRSNVKMHHVTVVDFLGDDASVIDWDGRAAGSAAPATYATGNEIYSCTFTNNSDDFLYDASTYFAYAALSIGGQSGMLIHTNIIDNVTGGRYGYGIKCIAGYLRGCKIYDNTIDTNMRDEVGMYSYAFAIELWTGKGGNEIYNNECTGGIDFSGYGWDDAGGYGFALKVYDNIIALASQPVTIESGLIFESGFDGGVYVYNNYVTNFQTALVLSLRENSLVQNIDGFYVYYNIFTEIGQSATMTGYGMQYNMVKTSASYTPAVNDFRVYNNVFYRADGTVQIYGINMVAKDSVTGVGADWSNVSVKNNIWFNVYTPCKWEDQTIDIIGIDKNISHNATNNNRFVTCTVTNDTVVAMVTDDPTFVSASDYHLQAGSPCINAGIDVGLTTDYDDQAVSDPPEIGAYEY